MFQQRQAFFPFGIDAHLVALLKRQAGRNQPGRHNAIAGRQQECSQVRLLKLATAYQLQGARQGAVGNAFDTDLNILTLLQNPTDAGNGEALLT